MANVLNDYNATPGDPTVRIGNWVEERALLMATGQPRGAVTAKPTETAVRVLGSAEAADWTSHQQRQWQQGLSGAARQAPTLPSRTSLRDQDAYEMARAIVEAEEAARKTEKEEELAFSRFGHRAPVNRARVIAAPTDAKHATLSTMAITAHNSLFHTEYKRADALAQSAGSVELLHHKNTAFSTPIEISMGEQHHQLGI